MLQGRGYLEIDRLLPRQCVRCCSWTVGSSSSAPRFHPNMTKASYNHFWLQKHKMATVKMPKSRFQNETDDVTVATSICDYNNVFSGPSISFERATIDRVQKVVFTCFPTFISLQSALKNQDFFRLISQSFGPSIRSFFYKFDTYRPRM